MIAYIGLFGSAFIAATILPLQSEAVLVTLLVAGAHPVSVLIIVATVGNVLGSVVNWCLGRFLLRFKEKPWFPTSKGQLERAQNWYPALWALVAFGQLATCRGRSIDRCRRRNARASCAVSCACHDCKGDKILGFSGAHAGLALVWHRQQRENSALVRRHT